MGMMMKLNSKEASDYPYQKDAVFSPDKPGESSFWLDNKGAEKFGLDPSVKADFSEVVNIAFGMDKTGTERTSGKNADDHFKNGATEIVLTCGKSISIMCTVDKALEKDIIDGYKDTAKFISTLVEGRETVDGVTTRVKVDAPILVSAHGVARLNKEDLAAGRVEDPQTHVHVTVMNNCEHENGKTGAIENQSLYDNQKLIRQFENINTARATISNGYEVTWHTDKQGVFYAEEKTITAEQREAFSNRHNAITRAKGDNLSHDSDRKAQLLTKADKDSSRTIGELNTIWTETRAIVGIDAEKIMTTAQENKLNHVTTNTMSISEIVSVAIKDVNENESKFRLEDVMLDALKMSRASYDPNDVVKGVQDAVRSGELVKHGELFTTPEMIQMENGIVKYAQENLHEFKPLMSKDEVSKVINDFNGTKTFNLSAGQASAVELVLTTESRISMITGRAGTGKTTCMEAVYQAFKDNPNVELIGLAPTGKAAAQLQEDSGIKSQTVASYRLQKHEPLAEGKERIILCDEISLLDVRDLNSLVELEKGNNTRIIGMGDNGQIKSVGAGQISTDLAKTDIPQATISEVQRQILNKEGTNQYSIDATEAFKNHQVREGFEILKEAGKVTEIKEGREACIQATAEKYCNANVHDDKMSYKDQLKLAGVAVLTNADRTELNQAIRTLQRDDKYAQIGKEDFHYKAERAVSMTASEKRFAGNYEVGNFVNITKDMKAGDITIKAGSTLEIIDRDIDKGTISYNLGGKDNDIKFNYKERAALNSMKLHGTVIDIDTKREGNKLSQFSVEDTQYALFEKMSFTSNSNTDEGKANGFKTNVTFMALDRDDKTGLCTIVTESGKIVKNFDFEGSRTQTGSVNTAHKEQGATFVNKISMILSSSIGMMNENINYVLMSRQKEEMEVVTDNYEKIVVAAMEAQEKSTTNDGSIIQYPTTNDQPVNSKDISNQNKPLEMEESKYSFENMSKKLDDFISFCETKINSVLFPEPTPPESPILSVEATPPEKAVDLINEQSADKALDQEHTQGQESGTGHDKGSESIAEVAQDNSKGLESHHDDDPEPEPEKVRHQSYEMSM